MLRYCASSIIVLLMFASSVSAEKITSHRSIAVTDELRSGTLNAVDLLDESFQSAVIAAAPSDWRESMGADVWWVPFDGANIQVMVFPKLYRPSNGQPNCCLHFETEGTEFWLKIKGIDVSVPGGNLPDAPGSGPLPGGGGSSGGNDAPGATPNEHSSGGGPHGAPGAGAPGNSPNSTGGGPGTPDAIGNGTPPQEQSVIAQVPEPGALVLLGMAGLAASRRIRRW